MTGILERAHDAAGSCAAHRSNTRAYGCSCKPACRYDRTEAGNGQQAQACEQTASTAKQRTGRGAAADVAMVVDAVMLDTAVLAMNIVGDDADVAVRDGEEIAT